jgi:hypothetical protein
VNTLTIVLLIVIVTFTIFAIALCRVIARADERMEWLHALREEELRRTWKGDDDAVL